MITANDIVKANEVLKNVVERTPLDFDRYLSENTGQFVVGKLKSGSFVVGIVILYANAKLSKLFNNRL